METNKIYQGDCIEVMKGFPDNSIDACVTDPPYGLEFMGKDWDNFKQGKNIAGGTVSTGKGSYWKKRPNIPAFAQRSSEELFNFQQWCQEWSTELLRILKPGGYLLAFGGTRTYHRLACGIEDAGFEIRDCIMWVYGSGFPKSLNIAKQLEQELCNYDKVKKKYYYKSDNQEMRNSPPFRNPLANQWAGWGTALKPACEPIVVARKPLSEKNVASNVLKHGTGGINIDECKVGTETIPEQKSGDNALMGGLSGKSNQGGCITPEHTGRFPANIIFDEEAAGVLDRQSGDRPAGGKVTGNQKSQTGKSGIYGLYNQIENHPFNDNGGASRFFYVAKASTEERNWGCENIEAKENNRTNMNWRCKKCGYPQFEGQPNSPICKCENPDWEKPKSKNNHPTVKPLQLMRYLVKLVCRKEGIVIDPFVGSGTTAMACKAEGMQYIGIDKTEEYVEIAKKRIEAIKYQAELF